MKMSKVMLMGLAWLVVTGLGCDQKNAETNETKTEVEIDGWCHWECPPPFFPDGERRSRKGGVIHTSSAITEPEIPQFGVRPEVLIVTVERPRGARGTLEVAVKQLKDVVGPGVLSRFREQWAVVDFHCTGTFISANEILTAEHCLQCSDWARTYAVMGFHAQSNWEVRSDPKRPGYSLMSVPPENVVQLSHVNACETHWPGNGRLCSDDGGCDVALVQVCEPDQRGTSAMPVFAPRKLAELSTSHSDELAVYSHAWGLPLKRYSVTNYDPQALVAQFSNAAGGSGSPIVSANDVLGVVRGNVHGSSTTDCAVDPGSEWCNGQPFTPHQEIRRIKSEGLECFTLDKHSDPFPNGCRECNGSSDSVPAESE